MEHEWTYRHNKRLARLLEVVDDRFRVSSTIIAGQLPVEHWHILLPDPTVADAILDRLVHNAHKIVLKGSRCARC